MPLWSIFCLFDSHEFEELEEVNFLFNPVALSSAIINLILAIKNRGNT